MSPALTLGPFSLSLALLIPLVAIWLGSFVGQRVAGRHGQRIDPLYSWLVVLAVLVARVAYVLQYQDAYLAEPLVILDIRDGGFNLWAGLAAAFAVAWWKTRSQPGRRTAFLAALGSVASVGVAGQLLLLSPDRLQTTRPLPDIPFTALQGQSVSLQQFAGKPLIVNLWATWCPHCVREMPLLAEAQKAHPDVAIVLVNQGETAETVQRFLSRTGLVMDNLLLDAQNQAGHHFRLRALPATLFYDRAGKLVDIRVGALSRATLTERLQKLQ